MSLRTLTHVVWPTLAFALLGCSAGPAGSCGQSSNEGTWVQSCRAASGNSSIQSLVISSTNTFAFSSQAFTGTTCAVPDPGNNESASGTLTLGDCSSVAGTANLDIVADGSSDVGCGTGKTQYSLYKNDGTNLFLGETTGSDNCTTATRATALGTDVFVKQ